MRRRLLFVTALVIMLVAGAATTANRPAQAAFPGLNGKIAFAAARNGTWEIDVMNPDGTGRAKLPTSTGFDDEPAWSPDGTRIADVCSNFAICVMNADGSAQTRVTDTGPWTETWLYDRGPAWSPDGTKIAFASTRAGRSTDIYVVNSDGSALQRLGGTGGYDFNPAWSPDGTRIAFDSDVGGNPDIYVMTADGTLLTRLTTSAARDRDPSWSPDGARIAFTRTAADGIHLYAMNADGSGQAALTAGGWDEVSSAWSPDGTRIAFAGDRGGNWDIYTANPPGTDVRRLTVGTAVEGLPDWQTIPATPQPPLPAAPPPPAASGNARLMAGLVAWTVQLLAEASVLVHAAERSPAAAEAAAKRFRSFALRAKRSLAAVRPGSPRGRRVHKLAVAGFASFARSGRELTLAFREARRGHTSSSRRHSRAALKAANKAASLLEAAVKQAGL